MFITVGIPSSRRIGPTCLMAGCIIGAYMNTMTGSLKCVRHCFERRIDPDAKRLEYIRASTARRERAVPVLRDSNPCPCGKQCGGSRDIEGRHGATSSTACVDE